MSTPTTFATPAGEHLLYRRLWRWHFYAAFLVIPFVLIQAITGTLYLWHDEWADWAHPELRFVEPGAGRASYDEQLAAAAATQPHARPTTLVIDEDPRRATQVIFGPHHGGSELPFPVFVDPYSGQVLGEVRPWRWMPGWTRKLHGGWPLGNAGSWLLELGAGWAVVMILTGLYLWWPRDRGLLAALVPRIHHGRRQLMLDLHASVAVLFSVIVMVFLFTALPWTHFWGNQVLKPVQNALGQASPFARSGSARSTPLAQVEPMSLDEAVRIARAAGLVGSLELALVPGKDAAQNVRSRRARAADEIGLSLDRYSRAPLFRIDWTDYPTIPRWVATGVDLHEGTYFGRANQWFNSLVSLALVWISITGFLSWRLRRPQGRIGAPLRAEIRLPRWALATGGTLCVLMPLLGASVLLLWIGDTLFARAQGVQR